MQEKKGKLYQKVEKFVQEIMDVRAQRLNSIYNNNIDGEDIYEEALASIELEQRETMGGFYVKPKVSAILLRREDKKPHIKSVELSASENDIDEYLDGTKGEIVLNVSPDLRVTYYVDYRFIDF